MIKDGVASNLQGWYGVLEDYDIPVEYIVLWAYLMGVLIVFAFFTFLPTSSSEYRAANIETCEAAFYSFFWPFFGGGYMLLLLCVCTCMLCNSRVVHGTHRVSNSILPNP